MTGSSAGAWSGRVAVRAALLFFCLSLTMGILAAEAKPRKDKLTLHTASGAHVIEIEIAESEADKALGLMYRSKVPPNTGMLFP